MRSFQDLEETCHWNGDDLINAMSMYVVRTIIEIFFVWEKRDERIFVESASKKGRREQVRYNTIVN